MSRTHRTCAVPTGRQARCEQGARGHIGRPGGVGVGGQDGAGQPHKGRVSAQQGHRREFQPQGDPSGRAGPSAAKSPWGLPT